MRTARTTITMLCLLAVTACSQLQPRPDLYKLYNFGMPEVEQPPLIVIPGVLGSRLVDSNTGALIWPGRWTDILTSEYRELALEIDPQTLEPLPSPLKPAGLTETALGRDFYGQLVRTLENYGGFERGKPGKPVTHKGRRYYIFAYDWRQDNVHTAKKLDSLINQIRQDYADPELKVDIVAHSMGGLITRYYLRYGTTDVLDDNDFPVNLHGAKRINKVIQLGTPNLGSAGSLHGFLTGVPVVRRIPTEVLATMPSGYQLFPHPLNDWLINIDGQPLQRDLFDVKVWQRFEWSVFNPALITQLQKDQANANDIDSFHRYFEKRLERARRFVWSLTVPLPENPIRLIVFGGDCEMTPARLLVEEVDNESKVRLHPNHIAQPKPDIDYERLMLEPGDGRVTKPALLGRNALDPTVPRHKYSHFPLAYSFFLCEAHDRLTGNINFQDNLLNVLLSRDQGGFNKAVENPATAPGKP